MTIDDSVATLRRVTALANKWDTITNPDGEPNILAKSFAAELYKALAQRKTQER